MTEQAAKGSAVVQPSRPDPGPLGEPLTLARVAEAAPGLVKLAAVSGWHLLEWGVKTSMATSREMRRSLAAGQLPTEIVQRMVGDLRDAGRQALGRAVAEEVQPGHHQVNVSSPEDLQARGAELLFRSADVWYTEDVHPAFERILGEMAPDEARILRFLAADGPQPAIDVRTGRPFGIGSELVAGGLSMIGLRAGVRDLARTSAYQNNLFRLGLIWFSREEVAPTRYQVVEVQPDVAAAIKRAGRMPRIVRRSIHLTPFGEDFCRTCLPPLEAGFSPNGNGNGPNGNGAH
ncbi:MAG TPA: Abi-alpha family protein [Acidimicrobiales bacterium]